MLLEDERGRPFELLLDELLLEDALELKTGRPLELEDELLEPPLLVLLLLLGRLSHTPMNGPLMVPLLLLLDELLQPLDVEEALEPLDELEKLGRFKFSTAKCRLPQV